MNNQIQLVLKSSTAEMPLNDHELGIYLVPELDGLVGLPEIRTTSGVNAGYDGGWTSAQNYDARSITIRGVIANQDVATVERLRKQLVSLAGQGKKEELTLDLVTEAGNAYTLQVRTIALDMAMKSVLEKQEFMLQLRADDPLIYDASESAHEAFIQVSKATGGFLIDFELPLAITGGSDEAAVENNGFEQVPTITKMYGALHNPKLVNQTTNQFMQIEADLGFSEGQWVDPSEPVEGKSITINGAPADASFADIQLKGDTSQAGTPTPSAPVAVKTVTGENVVKICGKNLAGDALVGSISWNGTVVTFNGDEIKVSKTGTGGITANAHTKTQYMPLKNGESYAFSMMYKRGTIVRSGTESYYWRFFVYGVSADGTKTQLSNAISIPNNTATPSATAVVTPTQDYVGFALGTYIAGNTTPTTDGDVYFDVQIEKGSATDFEPYQGQSYEVNLGKNLFDAPVILSATITSYAGGTASATADTISISATSSDAYAPNIGTGSAYMGDSFYVDVKDVDDATLSFSASSSNGVKVICYAYNPSTNRHVNLGTVSSITSKTYSVASYDKILLRFGNTANGTTLTYSDIQLELGSTATTYAPYFTPIELCKIGTYQDYIWNDGGTWKKHKAVEKIALSSLTGWGRSEDGKFFFSGFASTYGVAAGDGYSDQFDYSGTAWSGDYHFGITSSGNLWVATGDSTLTSTDLFNTWLQNHNPVAYFQLATPTDTEITNAALVAQLEELLNNASMYNPQTNISSQFAVGNEQGELEVSYYTSKTPDIRDELIIDSRLRTITLNGVDVYHLKTAGSEFIMLAPGENRLSLESDIPGDNGYAQVSYKQGYLSI